MSLLRRHISIICSITALVFTTSAYAGLFGFDRNADKPQTKYSDFAPRSIRNYRQEMRDLAVAISNFGKSQIPGFVILPHEGQYLLNKSPWEYSRENYNLIRQSETFVDDDAFLLGDIPDSKDETTPLIKKYAEAIDGMAVNNHYCQNKPSDSMLEDLHLPIFSIDQCKNDDDIDKAIKTAFQDNVVIYPFTDKNTAFRKSNHQLIINENAENIFNLSSARNISFLLNDENFDNSIQLLEDIRNSNYDVIVIRPTFHNKTPFSPEDVDAMKYKKNGTRRLILAAFNISEISPSDYLWQKNWKIGSPDWIVGPSAINTNAYAVKYWTPEWKKLIGRYIKSITDTGYDGVFLTGLENHRYFEQTLPLE